MRGVYIGGVDRYKCRVYMDVKIYSHREDIKRAYIFIYIKYKDI